MDIKSTNSFYFCSKLYRIPRDCDKKDQSSCCSFSSQVFQGDRKHYNGHLSCNDGTSLFWDYVENDSIAKANTEGYLPQIKKQMKKYRHEKIRFFIGDMETIAYKIYTKTLQGYNFFEIISYGTVNGQSVTIRLMSDKELKSSEELKPLLKQIVRF